MKLVFLIISFFVFSKTLEYPQQKQLQDTPQDKNVFVITLDGFRWQELFNGADSTLLNNPEYTAQQHYAKAMYWDDDIEERRKRLMPFFWSVIQKEGQILGNRNFENKVNNKNFYSISYPGYNEIYTGNTDVLIASNKKTKNRNINLLEYLNTFSEYKNKIAVFSSWNLFPFILNENRSGIYINSGYEQIDQPSNNRIYATINKLQKSAHATENTRSDLLTFMAAQEYIKQNRPKVLSIALGGTDEMAHKRKYDQYLREANRADRIIADLWNLVQSMDVYRDKTTFIITTDHGRGSHPSNWHNHGIFVKGSSQTWVAMLGSEIKPLGELKQKSQLYQTQLAGTIGYLLGIKSYSDEALPIHYFNRN